MANQSEADEVARAAAAVAREKAELTRKLQAGGRSGEHMARHIGDELKPALGAALVVAGAAVAVGVTVALVRRGRRPAPWLSPSESPSALSTAAKAAGVWALRLLARRAAQEVVSRFAASGGTAPLPAPRFARP